MKRASILRGICALSLIGIFASQGLAQPIAAVATTRPANVKPAEPRIVRMTVSPAAVPSEPLKYSFIVDAMDQIEGNAVPFYMRAMLLAQQAKDADKDEELFGEYLDGPIIGPKRNEVEKVLWKYNSTIEQLKMGALRDTCRWEPAVREKGISALLPELSHIRRLVRLLAVQARIQIASKQYDQAIDTLRAGFTIARHMNEQPILIQGLISVSCNWQLLGVARDLAQQPDAPNLYWAIASLPHPVVDQRQVMMWEKDFLYFTFPQLKNAARKPMSAAEWQKLWSDLQSLVNANQGETPQMLFMASAFRDYPKAKKYLTENGFSAEQVEKMPVIQAVGIYFLHTFEQTSGNMWKWWMIPYPQARAGMAQSEKELMRMRGQDPGNLILVLLPAVNAAYQRFVWADREVVATQLVEAIRAYAATHDGRLPNSLDELTETPALHDPTTGKPFMYRVDGKTAIVESLSDADDVRQGLRLEITLR